MKRNRMKKRRSKRKLLLPLLLLFLFLPLHRRQSKPLLNQFLVVHQKVRKLAVALLQSRKLRKKRKKRNLKVQKKKVGLVGGIQGHNPEGSQSLQVLLRVVAVQVAVHGKRVNKNSLNLNLQNLRQQRRLKVKKILVHQKNLPQQQPQNNSHSNLKKLWKRKWLQNLQLLQVLPVLQLLRLRSHQVLRLQNHQVLRLLKLVLPILQPIFQRRVPGKNRFVLLH